MNSPRAVQPAAIAWFGAPVVALKQISSYSCRPRNNEAGERLSEHAFGNAIDIAAFTLADGRTITVKSDWLGDIDARSFLREVFAGEWKPDQVRWRFESESSVNYDFSKNVRQE